MKYKNIEIVNIVNFLNEISEKRLPQRVGYTIMRNASNFQKEYSYYEQALSKIVENYKDFFIKDSDGNLKIADIGVPIVDKAHMSEYVAEIQELLNIEVDVPIYKIDSATLDYEDPNGRYDVLTAKEMLKLIDLFCKEDKKNKANDESKGISEKDPA
ncbi:MAG TPA: hypothetical protein DCW90_24035 [Lachnospiraceae bacterium]|nr:hypothetical protein [Lachnospiraceae bacterium]